MFFGLCNLLATFQTMMNDILCPFINRNEAVCYMDNILIYSTSLADHRRITREILQSLPPGVRCIQLHHRSHPFAATRRWVVPPNRLYVKKLLRYRTELPDP